MNNTFQIALLFVVLSGLLLVMPWLLFPAVPFGVRIPLEFAEDTAVRIERRKYLLRMVILETILAVSMILFKTETVFPYCLGILILVSWGFYYASHRSLAKKKVELGWYDEKRQVVAASAVPRINRPSRFYWIFLSLPIIAMLVTVIICAVNYTHLPEEIHYAFPGSFGDWNVNKSLVNAFLPAIFQFGIIVVFGGFAWLRIYGRQPVEIEDPESGEAYQSINLILTQTILLLVALGFNCAISFSAMVGWKLIAANDLYPQLFLLAPVILCLAATPMILWIFRLKYQKPASSNKTVSWDDDQFWKLGSFYYNREDPSIMVNKRFGIGRTLNFGHPLSWVIIAGILLFALIKSLG